MGGFPKIRGPLILGNYHMYICIYIYIYVHICAYIILKGWWGHGVGIILVHIRDIHLGWVPELVMAEASGPLEKQQAPP